MSQDFDLIRKLWLHICLSNSHAYIKSNDHVAKTAWRSLPRTNASQSDIESFDFNFLFGLLAIPSFLSASHLRLQDKECTGEHPESTQTHCQVQCPFVTSKDVFFCLRIFRDMNFNCPSDADTNTYAVYNNISPRQDLEREFLKTYSLRWYLLD
jgi:hypothetical protein